MQNDTTLDFKEKSAILNVGRAKYDESIDNQIDGIVSILVAQKANENTFTVAKNAVIKGTTKSFYYVEGTEVKKFDFSGCDEAARY